MNLIDRAIEASARLAARASARVLCVWLALTVVGVVFASHLGSVIGNGFDPPAGTQSADVQKVMDASFPQLTTPYLVAVMKDSNPGQLSAYQAAIARRLRADPDVAQLLTPADLGVQTKLQQGTTLLAMTFKRPIVPNIDVPRLRKEMAQVPAPQGLEEHLTGMGAIAYDIYRHTAQQLGRIEAVGLVLSALVLVYVFGGVFAAILPLLTGVLCIAINNGLLFVVARFFQTTTTNEFITAIVGLAIGIDYPLFLLSRFREELTSGKGTPVDAFVRAAKTAGKATALSGAVVGASALFLGMLDVAGLRPAAVSIVLVVVTALALCFSFLPALLFLFGRVMPLDRLLRHRFATRTGAAIWERLNRFVVDHPVFHLVGNLALLIALALPISQVKFWSPTISMLPKQMDSMQGLTLLAGQRESGQLSPIYVTVTAPRPGDAYRPEFLSNLRQVVVRIENDSRVASVESMVNFNPSWPLPAYEAFWNNPILRTDSRLGALVDNGQGGRTALIRIVPEYLPDSSQTRDLIASLHDRLVPQTEKAWPGVSVEVGGDQAQLLDTARAFAHGLPIIGLLNLVAITAILGLAFRSVILPIKAVLMNMLPLVASMGVVVLVFQFGAASSLLHVHPSGFVMMMTPAILLTVLFALSMDYEVMILSRIREAYDRTGDNRTAILEGLGQSGKVVVGAAAIMFSVFAAYLFSDISPMREVGLALATAILVDATVVRLALLPSAMMLMGRWNYWSPWHKEPVRLPPDPEAKLALYP